MPEETSTLPSTSRIATLLSVSQIAILVNRTTMTIQRRIRAKGIQPAIRLAVGGARYNPSIIEQLGPFKRPNVGYTKR